MDDFNPTAPAHPTIEPFDEPPATSWPKVIGVISLIYALLGMTCSTIGVVAQTFLMEFLMKMGNIDVQVPLFLKIVSIASLIIILPVGIYMLMGAIALLKRQPAGVTRLKRWAIIRIILIVLLFPMIFLSADMQIDIKRQTIEMQADQLREAGRSDLIQEYDEDKARRGVYIQHAIMNAVVAIYPFFLGFFLSRKKIEDETATWI